MVCVCVCEITIVKGLRGSPLDGNLFESWRGVNAVVLLPTHPKVADLQHAVVSHQAVPRRQVSEWTKTNKLMIGTETLFLSLRHQIINKFRYFTFHFFYIHINIHILIIHLMSSVCSHSVESGKDKKESGVSTLLTGSVFASMTSLFFLRINLFLTFFFNQSF